MKQSTLRAVVMLLCLFAIIAGAWCLSRHQLMVAERQIYKTSAEKLAEIDFEPSHLLSPNAIIKDLSHWRTGGIVDGPILQSIPTYVHEAKTPRAWKNAFLHTLVPNVRQLTAFIKTDRTHLLALLQKQVQGRKLSKTQKAWLERLFKNYRIEDQNHKELLKRLDEIPLSMVLAQAANESAWGRSRFAKQGNALFGQWTWGSDGIIPNGRPFGAKYRVKSFDSISHSIHAYMMNINTHPAYRSFREQRAQMRQAGEPLQVGPLVRSLSHYSERGEAYPEELLSIIRVNKLQDFEQSR